ncbi:MULTISPECIES: hypothetical protein [Comamonas]|jgi:hypothetical protein|uniref:Uncharacterized protein n=1 Tax=Comamonas testosteroni TaxID=285 RepID=A0A096FM56_COMTE|nr:MULTISPECIES: hypothetical protein [Comamonas]KGH30853.1 hypothetical protein P353_08305 [Comamonas testosteroni]KKI13084.1 hypothetical protein XA67_16090 [Comamonas thiooxydans]WKL18768.1 hypothetical protein QYQ99_27590 [Comamonas testosteroni]
MAVTRDPAPSGKLKLVDYFHETSSTHVDTSREIVLVPHGKEAVMLEIQFEHNNAYKGTGTSTIERWSIDREQLVELIKANGQRESVV